VAGKSAAPAGRCRNRRADAWNTAYPTREVVRPRQAPRQPDFARRLAQFALNKKLTGKTLAEIRQRLSDLDRSRLLGVEKAQAIQLERKPAREAAQTMKHGAAAVMAAKSSTPSHGPEKAAGGDKKPSPAYRGPVQINAGFAIVGGSGLADFEPVTRCRAASADPFVRPSRERQFVGAVGHAKGLAKTHR
jgi:hypothetical protein